VNCKILNLLNIVVLQSVNMLQCSEVACFAKFRCFHGANFRKIDAKKDVAWDSNPGPLGTCFRVLPLCYRSDLSRLQLLFNLYRWFY
jgi:hypothetical protein